MSYFRDRIERLQPYVPGEQPDTGNVTKLNTNENPYPPSPRVLQAIAEIQAEDLRRYPDPVFKAFRCAAAERFGVRPEMIICGNGMDELLRILIQACCDEGRPLAYPTPTYSLYEVLAETMGVQPKPVPFEGDYALPVEALAATGASLILVVNPNSPTGTFVPIEAIGELADRVRGRAIVGVDEAYVDFADEDALRLARQRENVLVLRTLSKGYSLAGLRFGFAIGPAKLIQGLYKIKDSYNLNAVALKAATAAIQDLDYARGTWQKVIAERERLTEALAEMGFEVLPSKANFLLAAPRHPAAETIYEELKRQEIFVRYFDIPGLDDKLRITVGTPEQNSRLLEALKAIIRTCAKR